MIRVMTADLLRMLDQLDDPIALERPMDYDHGAARAHFDELVEGLDERFGTRCHADREVPDASLHGRIEIPGRDLVTGTRIVISVSNFGALAVISAENPGAYEGLADAIAAGAIDSDDLRAVEHCLEERGFTAVPEELLHRTYDGRSALAESYPPDRPPTWWVRFFDYL
jgi:hypothetical protein